MCLPARLQRLDRGNAALEIVARTVAAVEEMRDCVVKAEKSGGLRVVCGPAAAFVRCHGASPCGQSRIAPALDGQKPRWRRGCLDQIGRAACRARVWKNVEI